jgi:hypothetical protein
MRRQTLTGKTLVPGTLTNPLSIFQSNKGLLAMRNKLANLSAQTAL